MDKLRDIRELEPIADVSFYLFVAMILFISLIIGSLLYMLYSRRKQAIKNLTRDEVKKRLLNVDLNNSKKAAYEITKYGRYLADDERSKKIFEKLQQMLHRYKFVPDAPEFDEDTIRQYNLFVEVVDG